MGTREDRTSLGRESKKAGGWGEGNDDNPMCPRCNKRCCGAKLNARQMAKIHEEFPDRCEEPICHRAAGFGTDHSGFGRCKGHFGATAAVSRSAFRQQARAAMRTYGVPVEIDPEDALREEIHRTVGHVRWLAEKVASLGDDEVMTEGPIVNGSSEPQAAKVIDIKPTRDKKCRHKRFNEDCLICQRSLEESNDDDAEANYERMDGKEVERLTPTGHDVLVYGVTERQVQAGGEGGGYDRVTVAAAPNIWLQVYMAERKHLADITKIAMAAGLESRRLDWAEGMADRLISAMEDLATQLGHDPTDPKIRMLTANTLERLTARAS